MPPHWDYLFPFRADRHDDRVVSVARNRDGASRKRSADPTTTSCAFGTLVASNQCHLAISAGLFLLFVLECVRSEEVNDRHLKKVLSDVVCHGVIFKP